MGRRLMVLVFAAAGLFAAPPQLPLPQGQQSISVNGWVQFLPGLSITPTPMGSGLYMMFTQFNQSLNQAWTQQTPSYDFVGIWVVTVELVGGPSGSIMEKKSAQVLLTSVKEGGTTVSVSNTELSPDSNINEAVANTVRMLLSVTAKPKIQPRSAKL